MSLSIRNTITSNLRKIIVISALPELAEGRAYLVDSSGKFIVDSSGKYITVPTEE